MTELKLPELPRWTAHPLVTELRAYLASLTPEQRAAVGVRTEAEYQDAANYAFDRGQAASDAASVRAHRGDVIDGQALQITKLQAALSTSEARCEGLRGALETAEATRQALANNAGHWARRGEHEKANTLREVVSLFDSIAAALSASAPPGGKDSPRAIVDSETAAVGLGPEGLASSSRPDKAGTGETSPGTGGAIPPAGANTEENRHARESRLRNAGYDQRPIEEQLATRQLAPVGGTNTEEEPVSIHRSKEWWTERARQEGDSPVGAGAPEPMTPIATAGGTAAFVSHREHIEHLQSRLASQQAELDAALVDVEEMRRRLGDQTRAVGAQKDRAEKAEAELALSNQARDTLRAALDETTASLVAANGELERMRDKLRRLTGLEPTEGPK